MLANEVNTRCDGAAFVDCETGTGRANRRKILTVPAAESSHRNLNRLAAGSLFAGFTGIGRLGRSEHACEARANHLARRGIRADCLPIARDLDVSSGVNAPEYLIACTFDEEALFRRISLEPNARSFTRERSGDGDLG